MTLPEYVAQLERRQADAAAVHATAPLADVYGQILDELRPLAGNALQSSAPAARAPDRLLRAEELMERLGLSRRAVYEGAKTWPFTHRIGRSVRFSERDLERWLATHRG